MQEGHFFVSTSLIPLAFFFIFQAGRAGVSLAVLGSALSIVSIPSHQAYIDLQRPFVSRGSAHLPWSPLWGITLTLIQGKSRPLGQKSGCSQAALDPHGLAGLLESRMGFGVLVSALLLQVPSGSGEGNEVIGTWRGASPLGHGCLVGSGAEGQPGSCNFPSHHLWSL